jgi:phosphatidylserine/phosphatidylglycerophosphate/cardiolipin synthase-like enzyme
LSSRCIKNSGGSSEISGVISSLFICEMMCPSKEIWLFSPWISDTKIIEKKLCLSWPFLIGGEEGATLAEVISFLSNKGTKVMVATKKDGGYRKGTDAFIRRLAELKSSAEVRYDNSLHEKGLLTNNFYLSGSMNFTFTGLSINRESIVLEERREKIDQQKAEFSVYWESLARSETL